MTNAAKVTLDVPPGEAKGKQQQRINIYHLVEGWVNHKAHLAEKAGKGKADSAKDKGGGGFFGWFGGEKKPPPKPTAVIRPLGFGKAAPDVPAPAPAPEPAQEVTQML